MKHAVSQELFQYWSVLRGARTAPERGDLDPAMIRGILADTFVLEVTSRIGTLDRGFSIRLSGTRVNALFLEELKQCCFLSLWSAEERDEIEDMLNSVLDDQTATVAGVHAAPRQASELDLELLLLPLRHHGHTHRRILGSLAPFRIPSWFGLRPVEHLGLSTMRTMTTAAQPNPPMSAAALAGEPSRQPVRRGRFVVHHGGR